MRENRRLAKELAQYQGCEMEQSRQSARSGRKVGVEKHRIASSGSKGDDDGSTRDGELGSHEEEDAFVGALQKFQYGPREGRKKSPGRAGGAKTERQSKAAGSGDGVVASDLGEELGGEGRQTSPKPRRSGRVSASRRSPRRHRVRRENPDVSPQRRLELEVQLEIVKQLQALRGGGTGTSDDAPDGNCLDGLRIMRSLAAWELTYLPNRLSVNSHGGTEVEMETILGYLRTRDDLARKSSKGVQELLSDAEEEDAPAVPSRPEKPVKQPEGGRKGKEENV